MPAVLKVLSTRRYGFTWCTEGRGIGFCLLPALIIRCTPLLCAPWPSVIPTISLLSYRAPTYRIRKLVLSQVVTCKQRKERRCITKNHIWYLSFFLPPQAGGEDARHRTGGLRDTPRRTTKSYSRTNGDALISLCSSYSFS